MGGFKTIHHWHHEVHDYELEILLFAVAVFAFEVEPILEFLDRLFSISCFLRKYMIIDHTNAAHGIQDIAYFVQFL